MRLKLSRLADFIKKHFAGAFVATVIAGTLAAVLAGRVDNAFFRPVQQPAAGQKSATPIIARSSEDERDPSKPLDSSSKEVEFLLGTWCSDVGEQAGNQLLKQYGHQPPRRISFYQNGADLYYIGDGVPKTHVMRLEDSDDLIDTTALVELTHSSEKVTVHQRRCSLDTPDLPPPFGPPR